MLTLGVSEEEIAAMESEEQKHVDEARQTVEAMDWPEPSTVTKGVTFSSRRKNPFRTS